MDHKQPLDMEGVFAWAKANGRAEQLERLLAAIREYTRDLQAKMRRLSVRELLLELNGPAAERMHGHYLTMATFGGGDEHPGADMVADWYERNLKIFANLAAIAASPDDRVLAVFGSGHGPLLRTFVRECPGLALVPAEDFLGS